MTYDPKAAHFYAQTYWMPRKESAAEVAKRLQTYLNGLSSLDPTLSHWVIGRKCTRYLGASHDLTSVIVRNANRDGRGTIEAKGGYGFAASSLDERQFFGMHCRAGDHYPAPLRNYLDFHTTDGIQPDPSIVTYELFKAATLCTIACWEPTICFARSSKLVPDFDNEGWFAKAWMTYVTPEHAASVDLTGIPISEQTPDGGLLLSATTELFDPGIPTHIEGARRISQATQHLNATLPPT